MRRSPLKPGAKSLERGSTFSGERKPLGAGEPRKPLKQGNGFSASPAQRRKVRTQVCVVCGSEFVDAAHVIDRSLGGDDDPRAVVALCRHHHDEYDGGRISILEFLEPHYRDELAYAVQTVGLITALERITNERWCVDERRAA